MTVLIFSRRALLASVGGGALSVSIWGCTGRSAGVASPQDKLLRMARLLYPHEVVGDDVYAAALQPLMVCAENDPSIASILNQGVAMLDRLAGGDWLSAGHDEQFAALVKLEDGEFFKVVKNTFRSEFYEQPAVWELIGYEGPSAPYGGYINRGFDDIDWLPGD